MSIGEPWQREPDGVWMVPARIEAEDTVGFAWQELTPDHPLYEEWMSYIRKLWARDLTGTAGPPV